MFAEAALVVLVLERFLRAVLDPDVTDGDTLYNLLQRAVSKGLIVTPWDSQEDGIRRLKDVRNTILHGNYERAARDAGCASVESYFKTQFASEVEAMFNVTDHLVRQIDRETGLSHRPRIVSDVMPSNAAMDRAREQRVKRGPT